MGKTKTSNGSKLKSLGPQVDRVGTLRDNIKALQSEEKDLAGEIKNALDQGVEIFGEQFFAFVQEQARKQFDVEAIYKKLGKKKFLEVVSVSASALAKHLGMDEIDEVTKDHTIVKTLQVKPIKR